MPHYNKPPLSIEEQIKLLESRGLLIPDRAKAAHYLQFISYYRLSGYAIYFEGYENGKRNHQFRIGTTFDDIISLYTFDRHLRLHVMDAIERIEVAVRTQICLKLAIEYKDSHWYTRSTLFSKKFNFDRFITDCTNEHQSSQEVFVKHYKQKYSYPKLPPAWMMIELLSLGGWSKVYSYLENRKDKKQISDTFHLSPIEFSSWLHSLTYIRNLCAHHARLWNRHFTITPKTIEKYAHLNISNRSFAYQAIVLHEMLSTISPGNSWLARLVELFKSYPNILVRNMGFPEYWHLDSVWGLSNSLIQNTDHKH